MARPLNDSPYLYGLHDPGGEHLMAQAGVRGWILFTEELGSDPNDGRSRDYSPWADAGYGILVRLNHGYEPNGTIPRSDRYEAFSRRVANFVAAARGCHLWIIGNEPNFAVERPGVALDWSSNPPRVVAGGEVITPRLYAACYRQCRKAIKGLPGRANDQVITAAVAPWNNQTTYPGNPTGDWVQYQADLLAELGPKGCDALSIHAYTHGADPSLIHTNTLMAPPFGQRQYNFRVYQDFLRGVPPNMRQLPVYLTEIDQNDAWQDVNRGWIQRAYGEIDWWNRQAGTQVIRAVILYRWPNVDRWGLESKPALHEDFRQAMMHKYNWEAAMNSKPAVTPPVQPPPPVKPPPQPPVKPPAPAGVAQPGFVDITGQLARDPAGFVKRTRPDIKYVVINHTGVRPEIGADLVANAQRQRWPGILSQFFVTSDGKLQRTNPDLEAVTRDQDWIYNGLNVYVAGNFDAVAPSAAQLATLAHLCAWLMDQYDLKADALKGVSEFIETHSPGLQWLDGVRWKEQLLTRIAAVPGSPIATLDSRTRELLARIDQLQAQLQALQALNETCSVEAKSQADTNAALKQQLAAAEAEKKGLLKRIAELEARLAGLTGPSFLAPPPVRDVTADLPTHATERYDTRPATAVTVLAIHHSAVGGDILPDAVAAYHVRKGWPGMGYHYYITADGVIYQCNPIETVSYHAGLANPYSLGICLAGRLMESSVPTDEQMASLVHLVAFLTRKLKIPLDQVLGHKELPEVVTACPGSDWLEGKQWKAQLLAAVKSKSAK